MHHWAGIKPKVLNQNKTLAQKGTPRNKTPNTNHSKTTNENKALEEEVAKGVQHLLALNKDNERDNNDGLSTSSNGENVEVTETTDIDSNDIEQQNNAFKTPENTILAPAEEIGYRKKSKKGNQLQSINKRSNLEAEFLEYDDHTAVSYTHLTLPTKRIV